MKQNQTTRSSQHIPLHYESESWTLTKAEWKEKLQLFLAELTSDIWVQLDALDDDDKLMASIQFKPLMRTAQSGEE